MDELDLLKKDWKKNDTQFPKVSEQEIYGMLHEKSSSIVKWIFIVSVLEILLWSAINFFTGDDEYFKILKQYHIKTIMDIYAVINYAVIIGFIYLFYKNFRTINATDNVKLLMKSILKTRKTVQYYIWYNLGMITLGFIIVIAATLKYDTRLSNITSSAVGNHNNFMFWVVFFGLSIVFIAILLGVFWLFYKLLYGFLLKRLYANFEELKKIDL